MPHFLKLEIASKKWAFVIDHYVNTLKEHSRKVLAQESADLHKDQLCHHVNIVEVKQLADDVIILKLIVTSSFLR